MSDIIYEHKDAQLGINVPCAKRSLPPTLDLLPCHVFFTPQEVPVEDGKPLVLVIWIRKEYSPTVVFVGEHVPVRVVHGELQKLFGSTVLARLVKAKVLDSEEAELQPAKEVIRRRDYR